MDFFDENPNVPAHLWAAFKAHAIAYDAKMLSIVQTTDTSCSPALIQCRKDPTISDLLEDFKARVARDELPGEAQ